MQRNAFESQLLMAWLIALVTLVAGCERGPALAPLVVDAAATAPVGVDAGAVVAEVLANEPPPVTRTAGLLWEVDAPQGASGSSWLFGTVHVGIDAHAELAPVVWEKLEEADRFVMEADIRQLKPQQVMAHTLLPQGQSLRALMSQEGYERLKRRAPFEMSLMMDRFQPWFVVMQLQAKDLPSLTPMDVVLMEHAQAHGAEVLFLEEVDEQFARMKQAYGVEDLEEFLADYEELQGKLSDTLRLYRQSEAEALEALTLSEEELEEHGEQMEIINFQRNDLWMPTVEAQIRAGGAFIAVGTLHLLHERGLVEQLQARGIQVRRLH